MSGFSSTEKIILGFAMIALMVLSYFLYDDSFLFSKSNSSQFELIGDVSQSQNDVRRKNLDTFSWIPASENDKIFQNDSIFTGERSEALILLQDGTQIKLQPNSLITLNLKDGQMNLNLRYGNLVSEIAKNSSLTIKSGTEEFKLESTSESKSEKSKIELKKNHSGTTDIKLISGNLKYFSKKDNTLKELQERAEVSVLKNGEVKKVEKPVLTIKTANNIHLVREKTNDPIPFEWIGEGEIGRYELEISSSEDFHSIAITKATTDSKIEITDPLKSGPYFWRLKALDKDGDVTVISAVQNMLVTELAGPQITTPVKEAQINLELKIKPNEALTTTTEVQWTAQPQLMNFIWQVAQDAEFKNILNEGQTKKLSTITHQLPKGTYWVRIQGQTESQKNSPWSEPVSFTLNLVPKKEDTPSRPILVFKTIEFKAPLTTNRKPSSTNAPKIAWHPVLQAKNYHLQISRDIHFKEVQKYDVNKTQVAWSQYRPGKYFYRVYAQGLNGLVSESSETGTLNISVGTLTLTPLKPIDLIAPKPIPKQALVSWNEVPFAKRYLLQMDKNKNFSQPQQFEFTSTKGVVTLSNPGRYNIRVQALDGSNKPLTEFSNVEEALYTYIASLNTPPLLEPLNNASIFLQTETEPFIWLEWKKVDRAEQYNIEISDKPDFSRLLITKSLKENRYLIKDKVPLGKIYWRVQAVSKSQSKYSPWTKVREFTLYHQKNESFIQ